MASRTAQQVACVKWLCYTAKTLFDLEHNESWKPAETSQLSLLS